MNFSKGILALSLLAVTTIGFNSCEKDENEANETKISTYQSTKSHNNGQNCMTCHVSGGEGEGWFKVAGSVYGAQQTDPYPNTTIKLFAESNGAGVLKATVEVDGLGNFYTTEDIDFGAGLYPVVIGVSGTESYMQEPVTNGQCSSCHGNTTGVVWAGL